MITKLLIQVTSFAIVGVLLGYGYPILVRVIELTLERLIK
jgi:hypothetical protein